MLAGLTLMLLDITHPLRLIVDDWLSTFSKEGGQFGNDHLGV
jgi:hypothetical protein